MIELDNKLNEMKLFSNNQEADFQNNMKINANRYGNGDDYSSDDYCAMESSHSNSTLLSFQNNN